MWYGWIKENRTERKKEWMNEEKKEERKKEKKNSWCGMVE